MPRAVILTALPVEYLAVRAHLSDLQEEMHPQGTIYERGKFAANGQVWEVGIAEVGAGNAGAAVEAERAIAHFKPDILLFVGIAGGIKDVAIGDVIAATKVYGYESGKVGEQFFTRPALGQSAHALVQRARAEARKGEWLQRLSNIFDQSPRAFVEPIAAGEKVVASKQSNVFQFLRKSYNDAIAVDMEGFGFLSAAFAYPNIKAIVIRGISSLIERKNENSLTGQESERMWQEKASQHASAFAFEVLSKLEIVSPDLRDFHQEIIALEANPQQRRSKSTPFQVPPLPSYFVERPEISRDLKTRLLEATATTGTLVVSAIHGLGGIGKSTLAAALAHEPDVLSRFPDGVFWATLGQQPDVLSLLTNWVQALGDYNFRSTDIEAASRHLCSLLHQKAALLVVDDVWSVDHAIPFRVGGSQCRVLITTRIADIARVVGATLYNLDVMTETQALALLGGRIQHGFTKTERIQAQALAEAVEYLPLALELAAAQVVDGIPWTELLADLRAEIARLDALDLPGAEEANDEMIRKKLSLLASFNLSLRRLSEESRQRFAWLGIVPEDVTLTQSMVTTLWETNVRKARDTLRYLRDKALLLEGVPLVDGTRTYRLHDLVHDLSRCLLTSPPLPEKKDNLPGLGLTLPEAHTVMLERYRKSTKTGLWHQLSDDGYIYSYLAWHMEQAGWEHELHALLREETTEGRNGWYQARDELGQVAGYIADVTRAWKLAEDAFTKRQSLDAIALQVRYALITASLNSIANNIPTDLLEALIERKVWTAEQGLAYARQKTDVVEKSLALVTIAPYLPETEIAKVCREALTIFQRQKGYYYGHAAALPRLKELIVNGYVKVLANRVPNRPESLFQEVLGMVKMFEKNQRLLGLSALMPYFPASLSEIVAQELSEICQELLEQDKEAFLQDRHISKGALNCLFDTALMEIAPYLTEQVQQILSMNVQVMLAKNCSDLESLLSPHLQEPVLEEVIREIQAEIDQIWQDSRQYRRRYRQQNSNLPSLRLERLLSPHLQESVLEEVIREIQVLGEPWNQYLHSLEQHLTGSRSRKPLEEVVIAVPREVKDESQLQAALIEARFLRDESDIANALVALVPHLSQPLLEGILAIVQSLQNEHKQAELLTSLASRLSETLLSEALEAVQTIKQENSKATALIGLIPFMPNLLIEKALVIAKELKEEEIQEKVLTSLVPHLTDSLQATVLEEILVIIQKRCEEQQIREGEESKREGNRIKDVKEIQVEAIADLASSMPESFKGKLLQEAINLVKKIKHKQAKVTAIRLVIPHLSKLQLEELLPIVRNLKDKYLLGELIAKLAFQASRSLLQEGLTAAQNIIDEIKQSKQLIGNQELSANFQIANILIELAPYLQSHSLSNKALEIARQVKYITPKVKAIASIACYLPNPQREIVFKEEVFTPIRSQKQNSYENRDETDYFKEETLKKIAPYLTSELLEDAFTVMDTIKGFSLYSRAEVVSALETYLPESQQKNIFLEKLRTNGFDNVNLSKLQATDLIELRSRLSSSLLPVLQDLWDARAIKIWNEFLEAKGSLDSERLTVEVVLLIPYLQNFLEDALRETLAVTQKINDKNRTTLLEFLGVYLSELSSVTLFPLWCDALHALASRTRKDLLEDLCALAPVIKTLGGVEAINETAVVIQDIGRWWR